LVAIATSLEELEKLAWIEKIHTNVFHLVKKNMKIGRVDHELAFVMLKKEIRPNASKIYSPVGKCAERAK